MKYPIFVILLILTYNVFAQDKEQVLQGQVTFVTTQNIYVKFADTETIIIGDTLRLATTNSACLLVKSKSSTSCVCSIVSDCAIQKGDEVLYAVPENKEEVIAIISGELPKTTGEKNMLRATAAPVEIEEKAVPSMKEKIRGRVSVASNSTISNERDARHRIMGRFSIDADHIKDSKFSFNSYLNYQQILNQNDTSSLLKTSFLRVYGLGVRSEATPSLSLTLGRNINSKISSIGAIDGLQVEKFFGNKYIGAIVGFRPDILNYGFNSNLLQYGGYAGIMTDQDEFYSQTTVGFIQQQNNGEIDRRYAYFQHTSTILENLNLFSSLELDLYSKVNQVVTGDIRLTNLYVSARYRFSPKLNLMVSYDSRKRILYYETFQTEIERLLDDDIARQGIRGRINVRPFKNILAGGSYSQRFQSDQENKSDNMYGYVTLSKVPAIRGRLSLSYNRNASNYLESNIASIRHSKDYFHGRLNADFYYRFVNYNYPNSLAPLNQHYFGTDLSYYINRKLYFSISGEFTTLDTEKTYRIYAQLSQRF
ncbi:MAG: hypothetical protein MUO53_14390 [Maribacter sp.]|nr:hypothetical protein [Maribacter sp.]